VLASKWLASQPGSQAASHYDTNEKSLAPYKLALGLVAWLFTYADVWLATLYV